MTIHSLLSEETILHNLRVGDKKELLNRLVDLLSGQVDGKQLESIREAVFEREEIMSTGVGKGLAIPHGKANGVTENHACFAILEKPVDYDSIDQNPVEIVFLLVGPESKNSIHIKFLSRISRLMNSNSFRERLLQCESPGEILEHFREEERHYFDS
ncbi:MAG: PTS sugar transporter subunit IIA [Balneolaceae bacterium]